MDQFYNDKEGKDMEEAPFEIEIANFLSTWQEDSGTEENNCNKCVTENTKLPGVFLFLKWIIEKISTINASKKVSCGFIKV